MILLPIFSPKSVVMFWLNLTFNLSPQAILSLVLLPICLRELAWMLPWTAFGAGGMIEPLLTLASFTHMLTPTKHILFPPPTWSMRTRNAGCMSKECERWREHHLSLLYRQLLEAWANKLLYSNNGSPPCCLRKEKLLIAPRWTGCAARSPSPCCVQLSNAFVELVLPSTDLTLGLMWTIYHVFV